MKMDSREQVCKIIKELMQKHQEAMSPRNFNFGRWYHFNANEGLIKIFLHLLSLTVEICS